MQTINRADFLTRYWRYKSGQHVTILGRTGSGKTRLGYQLLEQTATPRLPVANLVVKPRDNTARDFGAQLGLTTVRTWPPPPNPFRRRGPGWNVWPRHVFDPDIDDDHQWEVFRAAILDSYKRGHRIVYIPDVTTLTRQLNHSEHRRTLNKEVETGLSKGRAMDAGFWLDDQRPAWLTSLAYSSADHLFLAYEPDARYRKRFDEIGGIDAKIVAEAVMRLPRFHFLYIRREDNARCVITA